MQRVIGGRQFVIRSARAFSRSILAYQCFC